MARLTLKQAAQWCGGKVEPRYENVTFLGASNDTRTIVGGELFVALKGARDGHDFIDSAIRKGAAAVLCNHCEADFPAIVVEDTRLALGRMAREARRSMGIKVVGITGSVGKSTTKEMVASVLDTTFITGKTPANHNNDIGMPMAVLALPDDTQVAVLEMGMNHLREIAYLTDIAKPDAAVITNIGTMHIEHLKTQEGILQAKLEILEGMQPDAPLILNGDDRLLWNFRSQRSTSICVGWKNPECDLRAEHISMEGGKTRFDVKIQGRPVSITLPVEGIHFVPDALAAIAVGLEMGVTPDHIREGLETFRNMEGRQEILKIQDYTIIKDCYNAGPESMEAALHVLEHQKGRKIAVLGEMLELGVNACAEHFRIGRIAAETTDILLAYGPSSGKMVAGAITGGIPGSKALAFEDRTMLVKELKKIARPGDVLLFKGSHGMHMEVALDGFLQEKK